MDAICSPDTLIRGLRLATSRESYQLTADGFGACPSAIENTLSDRVDFAQLIKVYRPTPEGERRYSPAEVVSTEKVPVIGNPDPKRICTSHIERQNLTMRMQMGRLTRLTALTPCLPPDKLVDNLPSVFPKTRKERA